MVFYVILINFPILFIDSFNSEISSGAYRLVMIRPVGRWELLLAKWITQMSIVSLFLLMAFIESYIYGTFFIRRAEETFFLDKQVIYSANASILYTVKYYLILWFIASALTMLSSFVSLWFQNAIITYFVIVGLLVASLYVNEELSYFVIGSGSILRILSEGKGTFYLINGTILGGCAIAAMFSWCKKIYLIRGLAVTSKILLVDDEPDILTFIEDSLVMEGYEVRSALSGEEALKKLDNSVDLIILDVMLPDMNGFKVCEKMRESYACPILFLSADSSERSRIEGLLIGGDDYISKPFSLKELKARIVANLRRTTDLRMVDQKEFLRYGSILIDLQNYEIMTGKEKIHFTKKSMKL